MKKKLIILGLLIGAAFSSCTEYLNVSENSGLTDEEIFTNYTNTVAYFATVFNGDKTALDTKAYNLDILATFPGEMKAGPRSFTLDQTTDMFTGNKTGGASNFIKGSFARTASAYFTAFYNDSSSNNYYPVFKGMFNVIRTCNTVLSHLDEISDANDPNDVEDLRGQAYFVRAYAHFFVGRIWGPMPYITDVMTAENWDRPRLAEDEYFQQIANDLDTARMVFEGAGLMRRDPGPSVTGHLSDTYQDRPTGVAAMALKSRALLHRASPLNNKSDDKQYWIDAADAAAEALDEALKYEYALQSWDSYYLNFHGTAHTNEHLWSWKSATPLKTKNTTMWCLKTTLGDAMTADGTTGEFPTQNAVDMYDTAWGEPLVTEADRAAATAAGHYSESDPYANRDPRLAGNIFCNQATITWASSLCIAQADGTIEPINTFNSYYTTDASGSRTYSTFAKGFGGDLGDSNTGYIQRKRSQDYHKGNKASVPQMPEVLFRLVELYLNYAEAVNEAYGPTGQSPKGSMTALDALNVVRERVSADLVYDSSDAQVIDQTAFRTTIQKERTVELDQEGCHRYYDIRRWMIAPQVLAAPKYAMSIQKLTGVAEDAPYEQRFKHTRVELATAWQGVWYDYMYYWPFESDDYFKYEVFDTSLNTYW